MPKEFARSERVAQLINRELAVILRNDVNDPRVTNLTITEVEVTKDLRQAKVFVTSLNDGDVDQANIVQALDKANGFLRRRLANSVDLRHCPNLLFAYDNSIQRGAEMSAMIDRALNQKK